MSRQRHRLARRWLRRLALTVSQLGLVTTTLLSSGGAAPVVALPPGFTETVVFSGLANPTNIEFAADGRVFIAEKSGIIKVYDNVQDTTPTVFNSLLTKVHNFWDRGLLGLALDPSLTNPALPLRPWVYVLYAYDHVLGTEGPVGQWNDGCPSPPGATTDGCVVSGRLSRFSVSGTTIDTTETVLIEDWCQQFPSHSVGSLGFGPDGALYVSGGDGASFNGVDYGQLGGTLGPTTPKNPCADPPNNAMTPPTAEGGALRSQDLRTDGAPTGSAYAQAVLLDSPAAYWRLGEASGTNANDQTANNQDGTYLGGVTLGQPGATSGDTAPSFDGTGYVSAADANVLDLGNGPQSYEAWFNLASFNSSRVLISKGSGAMQLEYDPGDHALYYYVRGVSGVVHSSTTYTTPGWHHVVATKDGATAKLYVDGVDVTVVDATAAAASTATALNIGRDAATATTFFHGLLDEVAVYPSALTAARAQAHFAAASAPGGTADPVTLDGAILRVDPVTGAAFAGNPFASSSDPNKQRIIAYGLRNPFRFELRPGTSELWLGDVGWNNWEEINRVANTGDATVENFGWPCYEGGARMSAYDALNLSICEDLYGAGSGAITAPVYTYAHSGSVVAGDGCPTGGSAIAGMAFYPETGGNFPAEYRGGLFFADHNRSCIWWMAKGANGQPDPATRAVFQAPAANPVDLEIGLDGALYYANFEGNQIRKIAFSSGNQPPTAVAQASPTSGPAPLTVNFSGTSSTDPENGALTYEWDLDGDGLFDDSTIAAPNWTYTSAGNVTVRLRVTDPGAATDTDTLVISAGNTPPVPVINTPTVGTTWGVGQQIFFSGSASDQQDGSIPVAGLSWQIIIQHCPSNCHPHTVQTKVGAASGDFFAPDHEYPSWIDVVLTATDSNGSSASVTRRIDPRTVTLSFATSPTGLQLVVNGVQATAPFTRTAIEGSSNTISAVTPQSLGGATYTFQGWSDGGAASHTITASTSATYTATYVNSGTTTTLVPTADAEIRSKQASKNFGNQAQLSVRTGFLRSYLKFTVPTLPGAVTSAKLRVFVVDTSPAAGSVYVVGTGWTETGITWNNAPAITGSPLATGGAAPLGTWVEFTVTSAISSGSTISFALSGGLNDAVEYSSRTGANPPQLVITTSP